MREGVNSKKFLEGLSLDVIIFLSFKTCHVNKAKQFFWHNSLILKGLKFHSPTFERHSLKGVFSFKSMVGINELEYTLKGSFVCLLSSEISPWRLATRENTSRALFSPFPSLYCVWFCAGVRAGVRAGKERAKKRKRKGRQGTPSGASSPQHNEAPNTGD